MHKPHNHDIIQISKNQNDKSKYKVISKFNNTYISPGKTLALKAKCNYNIFILRSPVLSIAFFLLLRCKSKIGSTTRRKMTVGLKMRRRKWVFLSTWPLLGGSHLDFCVSDWCLVGKWRCRLWWWRRNKIRDQVWRFI